MHMFFIFQDNLLLDWYNLLQQIFFENADKIL